MPAKILVVDDAPETLALIEAVLTGKGYTVVTAANGNEGLKKVKSDRPHLIIADILMPEMDGFMFYKELKKEKDTSNIPVFVLTVRARMEDTFRAFGVEDFIVKPFDSQQLLDKIGSRLGFIAASDKPAASAPPQSAKPAAAITQKRIKKFLLIGTSESVVNKITALMPKENSTLQTVLKESQAVDRALVFDPDVFIVETLLNDRPAADLVAKIKNYPKLKAKPILLFSFIDKDNLRGVSLSQRALDSENSKKACLLAGASESMGGFEETQFLNVIQKYL